MSLPALGLTAPGARYDPIGLAQDSLSAKGFPPPPGYTVNEVPGGSLGGDRVARTDSDGMDIEVDVSSVLESAGSHGDASPTTVVSMLEVILLHEYKHTPTYGTPGEGGFNTGLCAEMDLAEEDLDHLCDIICGAEDPSVRDALCSLQNQWLGKYNSFLPLRNMKCPGDKPRKFLCGCCG